MEDTIFIKVLEYGEKAGIEGATDSEFWEWTKSLGINNNTSDDHETLKAQALNRILDECFFKSKLALAEETPKKTIYKNVLKTEYYFRLIEYRELQQSRAAAKSASKNAFIAIMISMVAIIFSIYVAKQPISINKSDLNALINSNKDTVIQKEVKLDRLQMAQILSAIGYGQSNPKPMRSEAKGKSKEISHHELINQYFEDEN